MGSDVLGSLKATDHQEYMRVSKLGQEIGVLPASGKGDFAHHLHSVGYVVLFDRAIVTVGVHQHCDLAIA